MALSDLETSTIERDQAEAVVNHLRAALRSVVDGPAGNPTIDVALRYSRDVATAALIREHGPRNAVASLARELRESRTENARLRTALEASRADVLELLSLLDVHAYDVETDRGYQTRTSEIRARATIGGAR